MLTFVRKSYNCQFTMAVGVSDVRVMGVCDTIGRKLFK